MGNPPVEPNKNRSFLVRLGFAFDGVVAAWNRERSFRTQVLIGAGALIFALLLRPGWIWVALVALSVGTVLAAELVNSAFEAMLDRLHPEIAPQIKLAKDIAAAAVLVAALAALAIALALLLQLFFG